MTSENVNNCDVDEQVAETLEVDPRLLSVIPELLEDLTELGCIADHVVSALTKLKIKRGARVLDLGCGKGAVAVALAEILDLHVDGVDALPRFLEFARSLARNHGVTSNCNYIQNDIREYLGTTATYDVVMLLSVGPISGDHESTINDLRRLVQPSGYIVIDDAFLAEGVEPEPPYESYMNYTETIRRLCASGDRLVHEVVYSQAETSQTNTRNTELIRRRARLVKARHPHFAELIDQYVARQVRETEVLGTDVIGALWIMQRI